MLRGALLLPHLFKFAKLKRSGSIGFLMLVQYRCKSKVSNFRIKAKFIKVGSRRRSERFGVGVHLIRADLTMTSERKGVGLNIN